MLRLHPLSLAGLAWLAVAAPVSAPYEDAAVTVRQAAPHLAVVMFEPAAPPPEMPPLDAGERAVTHSEFGIGAEVRVRVLDEAPSANGWVSTVEVEGFEIDLALEVTVWLPPEAPDVLLAHEDGHRRISELFYAEADPIARRLAGRYVGRAFSGRGDTVAEARHQAMSGIIRELNRSYLRATHRPAARVNELFDELTDHGRADLAMTVAMESAVASWRREATVAAGGPVVAAVRADA